MNSPLRIIFLGTPEFAVSSLKKLVEEGKHIVAVVTAPDKPSGRGLQMQFSEVKKYALSKNIPILQPEKLRNEFFLKELESFKADLQIIVAFRMLPEKVWSMPKLGTFNLHASLLPEYRGAAPIHWAIINGEIQTGLTTFFLSHEIDTGKIIFQETEPIHQDDTTQSLYERLQKKGADLVLKTVAHIEKNDYPQIPQKEIPNLKIAPKITKEMCEIDFNQSAKKNYDFIRGMSPLGAWTKIKGVFCKIYASKIIDNQINTENIGQFRSDGKTFLHFICATGSIAVEEIQLENKKRMKIHDFLNGNPLKL